jgi:hypothetical protein
MRLSTVADESEVMIGHCVLALSPGRLPTIYRHIGTLHVVRSRRGQEHDHTLQICRISHRPAGMRARTAWLRWGSARKGAVLSVAM